MNVFKLPTRYLKSCLPHMVTVLYGVVWWQVVYCLVVLLSVALIAWTKTSSSLVVLGASGGRCMRTLVMAPEALHRLLESGPWQQTTSKVSGTVQFVMVFNRLTLVCCQLCALVVILSFQVELSTNVHLSRCVRIHLDALFILITYLFFDWINKIVSKITVVRSKTLLTWTEGARHHKNTRMQYRQWAHTIFIRTSV